MSSRLACLCSLPFVLPLLAADSAPWQFRYAHQPDQTPEWTAMGRVPAFAIEVSPDGETVAFADAPDGRCRGWVLAARPLPIPDPPPFSIAASLEYQTFCELDHRSGVLHLFLATPEAWETFAADPADGPMFRTNQLPPGMLMVAVKHQGDDVTEWETVEDLAFPPLPADMRDQRELMAGLAWGTYHFCEERGGFRNLRWTMRSNREFQESVRREFWQALDLERPELAAVRTALEAGDEAAAETALARHFRQRRTPVVANPVGASDSRIARADETLARTYRLVGCPPYTFPDDIVWNADPFNYNQWPVALNRHYEWRFLAEAYLHTGDGKYAREWDAQVRHWVESMPVLIAPSWIQGPFNTPGKVALSLDAGIRTGQTWFPVFEAFKTSPSVSDEALLAFLRSCWQHGVYLMRPENYRRESNWGAMESNGLYHLGVMLPEFKDAGLWRDTALERTCDMMDYQVYPDGAQTELSPGYHGVSLNNFLGVMRLARANDLPIPDDFTERLERMFDYYLRITEPDLRTPGFNDSGRVHIVPFLQQGLELFPEREDFRWGAEQRRRGTEPDYLSCVMPWAGWVVMRSDWSADARHLHFGAGPFGTGHQHEDNLGIVLHAYGRRLITNCGFYSYDTSDWRRYVLSTRGHSTVRINNQEQNTRSDRSQYRAEQPDTYGFFDSPSSTYARSTHTAGYGNPSDRSVRHRRRVLFLKPDLFLVVDDFAASDDREHEAEIQFLLEASGADTDPASLSVVNHRQPGQPGIAILPLVREGVGLRIAQGETEPLVRGFIPRGFERLDPAPAVLYTHRFTGRATLAWLLVPFRGEHPPVTLLETATSDGRTHARLQLAEGAAEVQFDPAFLGWQDPARAFAHDEPPLPAAD